MRKNTSFEYLFGFILLAVGLFMLFKSAYVSSFGFWRFGRISTGGILLVLLIVSVIAMVVKPCGVTKWTVVGIVALLVVSILLGTHISFRYMSVADVVLILVPMAVGAGLVIKAMIEERK